MHIAHLPLLISALTLGWGAHASAAERPLKVVGSTSLQARVALTPEGPPRLEGKLTDDAGAPVPQGVVRMALAPGRHPSVRACGTSDFVPVRTAFPLTTDEQGAFCAELAPELVGAKLTLDFDDPTGLLGSTRFELEVTPAPLQLDLRLGVASELPLDTPLHVVEVAAIPRGAALAASGDAERAPPAPSALSLELALEAPHRERQHLGEVLVHPGERGRLEIPAERLGHPGTAALVARFHGNDTWAPAEARRHVSKTALVTLDVVEAAALTNVTPPVELPVVARWARGPVQSGSIEAFVGAQRVGAAPVLGGEARLILTFPKELTAQAESAEVSRRIPLTLVYVSNAPWWHAGSSTSVELTLAEPSLWTKLSWLGAALAVVIWVALIWRRPASRTVRQDARVLEPPGREDLAVIDADGESLSGNVFDAHTGVAVPGAILQVILPGVREREVLASARTDAGGHFQLGETPQRRSSKEAPLQLHIAAPGYAAFERPLPRRGRLIVHLVTLRRTVLDRLLRWAHRKGPPWHGRVVPTPAHIALTAEDRREPQTATWARRVEAAAYGPEPPDESLQRELHDAEPP